MTVARRPNPQPSAELLNAARSDYETRLRPTYGRAALLIAIGFAIPPLVSLLTGEFGNRSDLVNLTAAAICLAIRVWHLLPAQRDRVGMPMGSAALLLAVVNAAFINGMHVHPTPQTLNLLPLLFIGVAVLLPSRAWLAATVVTQLLGFLNAYRIKGWALGDYHVELSVVAIGLVATALILVHKRNQQERLVYLTAKEREFQNRLQEEMLQRFALQQKNSVNQRLASLTRFSSGLLNDFNNVLLPIAGHASLLADDPLTARQQQQVQQIIEATQRGTGLAANVGALAGSRTARREHYDFAVSVEELVTLIRRVVAEDARVHFHHDHKPDGRAQGTATNTTVFAPKGEAQRLLANLLLHIVELHDHEAAVNLQLTLDAASHERVKLVIRDATRTTRGERTIELQPFLVNLSETQAALAQIGGELTFKDNHSGDDLFEFSLPRQSTDPDGEVPTSGTGDNPRALEQLALVVDDEAAVRQVTGAFLQRIGFDVVEAENGDAAIARCEEACPDLIVMDLLMPGLPAQQAIEQIRARHGQIPVLICTGSNIDELQWLARLPDAKLLMKPYGVEDLTDAALALIGPQPN